MARRHAFVIVYDPEVKGHLAAIDRKHHSFIREAIEQQLMYQADVETRNRKPLARPMPLDADWELRFGPKNRFRVFYAVAPSAREVQVLAIGVKEGNRLFIAGNEVKL